MADFAHCFQFFESRKIHLHLLDCPFEYTTANGRAMLQMLCVFAEWSSRVTSERIKAAQVILRQNGRPLGGEKVFGYQSVGPKRQRRLEPDWEERAVLCVIARAREIEGQWDWHRIAALAEEAAERVYTASRAKAAGRRKWTWHCCFRAWKGFWRLVEREGAAWIGDPELKALAEIRIDTEKPRAKAGGRDGTTGGAL